jgi:phospholipid-binding lipoprotein MlaA
MPATRRGRARFAKSLLLAGFAGVLAACAVAPPRTDDPLQKFNRKVFAFNQTADKVAIRPIAKGYVKVTGPKERVLISNFFDNLGSPVTVINDLLQGRPGPALETTGRFVVNSTVGFLGFFNPASDMKLPAQPTDFGVTLAHWGVPEGPYLVLPFIGPTTLRDVWRLPVDSYFDPLGWYARTHFFAWHAQYLPSAAYLITLRASALPLDPMLDSAYDPYAFMRDAYRQHRLFEIYYGNPPLSAIDLLQGTSSNADNSQDIDQLLQQQRQYEKIHATGGHPASRAAPPSSAATPAAASSAPAASGGSVHAVPLPTGS